MSSPPTSETRSDMREWTEPLVTATSVETQLRQRLRAVSAVLLGAAAGGGAGAGGAADRLAHAPEDDAGHLLEQLVRAVQADRSLDRVWILCTAVFGAYPSGDDVVSGGRRLRLGSTMDAVVWLLDRALDNDAEAAATTELIVVSDRAVVDVDHAARHKLHTGIQQVVRRVVPEWQRRFPVLPVAWIAGGRGWRRLSAQEMQRVVGRGGRDDEAAIEPAPAMIVPWRTVAVLLETPYPDASDRLSALAQYSGNRLVAVGYDCVPVISADLVPPPEPVRFTRYLSVLKHARRIGAISHTAATEFGGFASAVGAQGLPGPAVVEVTLPEERLEATDPAPPELPGGISQVLSVGSLEPRKNHLALLYAAERLWREDLDFELVLIGGSGWGEEVPARLAEMRDAGRSIVVRRAVSSQELAAAYRRARFTVFPSLHEGYGLPVAESLAAGTPVITSSYGSPKEIAEGGGAVLVDPRDDDAVVDAMRRLLTDDDLLDALRRQARARPVRTWEDYATQLWQHLVEPELDEVAGGHGL